jgi:hypothetical protein
MRVITESCLQKEVALASKVRAHLHNNAHNLKDAVANKARAHLRKDCAREEAQELYN